jgi:hypothetical protein
VQLLGTGAVPTAEGPVYVDSATLDLPSGKLELVSGVLQFRQTDPFRPEAALSATARIQGYDVRAAITGALAGGELEDVQLSSSPPLAEDDLWVLVLTGQPPLDRWRDQNTQAMESVALFLAKDRVARWLAGDDNGHREPPRAHRGRDRRAQPSYTGQTTGRARLYLKKRRAHGTATVPLGRRSTSTTASISAWGSCSARDERPGSRLGARRGARRAARGCRSTAAVEQARAVQIDVELRGVQRLPGGRAARRRPARARAQRGGRADQADVDDSAFALESFYHRQGFPFALVEYELEPRPGERARARLTVDEGPRTRVRELRLEGFSAVAPEVARSFIGAAGDGGVFDEEALEDARARVLRYYLEHGFLRVELDDLDVQLDEAREQATVTLRVHEGPSFPRALRGVRGHVAARRGHGAGPAREDLRDGKEYGRGWTSRCAMRWSRRIRARGIPSRKWR